MNQPPSDAGLDGSTPQGLAEDQALVAFLRAHHPPLPDASPEAEARLMAAIAPLPVPSRPRLDRWAVWGVGSVGVLIAVGVLLLQRWLPSPPDGSVEFAQLDAFYTESWEDAVFLTPSLGEWDWIGNKPLPTGATSLQSAVRSGSPEP